MRVSALPLTLSCFDPVIYQRKRGTREGRGRGEGGEREERGRREGGEREERGRREGEREGEGKDVDIISLPNLIQ